MDFNTISELIHCLKRIIDQPNTILVPLAGEAKKLELKSSLFHFFIDINRRGRKKARCTLQLREKQHKDTPLLRLDLVGPPHPNPDGNFPLAGIEIPCPHLHIANPDYGDSIAYPLNNNYAKMYLTEDQLLDIAFVLKSFLDRCNVVNTHEYRFECQTELL